MKKVSLIILCFCFCVSTLHAASLTKPITLAWDQNQEAFIIPEGQTQTPINGWKLYQKDTPTGNPNATITVPYIPTQLSDVINSDGTRTYIYGPMNVTASGVGGTTVQRCWHVTALGNNATPPSETGPSNTACEDFILPIDPILAPGQPKGLKLR